MENKFNKMRIMVIISTILIILGLILVIVPIFLKFFVFTQICFIYLGNLILMISGSIGGFFFIVGIVLIIICLVILKNDGTLYEKYKLGTNVNNKKTEILQKSDYIENIDVNVIPPLANVTSLASQNTSTNIEDNRFENIPVIDTNTQVTQTVDYISPEEMANITIASVNEQHKTVEDDKNKQSIVQESDETPDVTKINTITNIKKNIGKPKSKMFEHD